MIVITTPTGSIGGQVLEKIVAIGEPVRVIVRDPSRLAAQVREKVDIIQGSHGDADVVNRAFIGAEVVFWLPPPSPCAGSLEAAFLDFTRPACEAIKRLRVERVVSVSALGRGTALAAHAGLVTASLAMDDLLASTGVRFRALTMPSFMDNLLRQASSLREQGVFFSPVAGDLKSPTCASRDIAAMAVRLILDRSWTGQGEMPILGPEDLSCHDQAQIMSEVLGKPIRYQQVPLNAFKSRLIESGMSEAFAQGYVDMMEAKNNGLDNAESRNPEFASPTSFRTWCEEILKPAVLN